jgi:dephospho-CoA kinase
MVVLGLTGSIGMGKSTAARMLRCARVPVCDSDAIVHTLLARGGAAVAAIGREFPGVVRDGAVDRQALGAAVFGRPAALERLEAIVHPRVRQAQDAFLRQARRRRAPVAVLDIPLLFETGAEARVDAVVVVSAPAVVQRARVLARPGMTAQKLAAILARQMPDGEKCRRADFVVETGGGRWPARRALRKIIATVRQGYARSRP